MEILHKTEAFRRLCKAEKKWGLFVSFGWVWADKDIEDPLGEICKAAPYLTMFKDKDDQGVGQAMADGEAFILFNTREGMEEEYWRTVGDDGPTETNPYSGPAKVYALTCDPNGQLMNENT